VRGLKGLLPSHVCTQEAQVARVLENFHRLPNTLDPTIFMTSLHDCNEALFFRVVTENPDVMMPIIYTPTVGLAPATGQRARSLGPHRACGGRSGA
jgi:malic enzyme